MRSAVFVCTLVVLACICSHAEAKCPVDGEDLSVGVHYRNCMKIECLEDGSMTGIGCAEWRCQEGKQTGYKEKNLSKPYPECCPGPICAS